MSDLRSDILDAVERVAIHKRDTEFPFRHHLGASILGNSCDRFMFYTFRWVKEPSHSSRVLRIFERGHSEEDRMLDKLTEIGLTITRDNGAGEQLRAQHLPAHIGGSLDAMLHVPANYVSQYGNYMPIECKTHNRASFNKTFKKPLHESYPQHYTQGNIYGWSWNTTHFMYVGLNKDTDELGIQIAEVDPNVAKVYVARGKIAVYTQDVKQTAKTDEKWRCNMCDFKEICKKRKPAQSRNCRSCANAFPVEDGTWICGKYNHIIEKFTEIEVGAQCSEWISII